MSIRIQDVMIYGGGECFARFGTPFWRINREQDVAATMVRGASGSFVDKEGATRNATANRLRVEWLDLDGDGVRETPGLLLDSADTLYTLYPHPPVEMTVFVSFVERGTRSIANGGVVHIGGSTSGGDPRFQIQANGSGLYQCRHDNGTLDRIVTAAAGPSATDLVELRGVLNADGSVLLGQSINGAAETVTATSASAALGAAWNGTRLYLNSRGAGNQGIAPYLAIKIVRCVQTMADMRALFAYESD